MDCIDALLFWINKICLLIRDEVENYDVPLQSNVNDGAATIPEMVGINKFETTLILYFRKICTKICAMER